MVALRLPRKGQGVTSVPVITPGPPSPLRGSSRYRTSYASTRTRRASLAQRDEGPVFAEEREERGRETCATQGGGSDPRLRRRSTYSRGSRLPWVEAVMKFGGSLD